MKEVISILAGEYSFLKEDEALILMGHGSDHFSNTVYAALDYMCKDLRLSHIHVGTVEAYPPLGMCSAIWKAALSAPFIFCPL